MKFFFEKIKVFLENLLTYEFGFGIILLDKVQNAIPKAKERRTYDEAKSLDA